MSANDRESWEDVDLSDGTVDVEYGENLERIAAMVEFRARGTIDGVFTCSTADITRGGDDVDASALGPERKAVDWTGLDAAASSAQYLADDWQIDRNAHLAERIQTLAANVAAPSALDVTARLRDGYVYASETGPLLRELLVRMDAMSPSSAHDEAREVFDALLEHVWVTSRPW